MAKYQIEELIEIIKGYPPLYCKPNIGTPLNADEKNSIWAKIAKELKDDPVKVKQKWRNLRDSYQKAMKTKKDLEEMGQLHRYHEYRHEKIMSFMIPYIAHATEYGTRKRKAKEFNGENKRIKKDSVLYSEESRDAAQAVEYLLETEDELQDTQYEQGIIYKEVTESELQQQEQDDENIAENEIGGSYQEYIETEDDVSTSIKKFEPEYCRSGQNADIDAWLCGVKYGLLKLSKLNQAQAKRDINNIISKYEIDELQSDKS